MLKPLILSFRQYPLVQQIGSLLSIMVFSKLTTVIRELFTAYYFGTGIFKDGFVAAYAFAVLFMTPFMESLNKTIVPKYLGMEKSKRFFSIFTGQFVCLLILLTMVVYIVGPPFFSMIYKEMPQDSFLVGLSNLKWMVLYAIIMLASSYLSQLLNANHRYVVVESRFLILNSMVLIMLWGNVSVWGIHPLVSGYVLGGLLGLLLLVVMTLKSRLLDRIRVVEIFQFQETGVYWINVLGIAALFTVTFVTGAKIQHVLSSSQTSVLSAHDFAYRFLNLTITFFVVGVLGPHFTKVSTLAVERLFSRTVFLKVLSFLVLTLSCLSGVFWVWDIEIVTFLFQRGAFSVQSVEMTALFLKWYFFAMVFLVVQELFQQMILAYRMNKTFMVIFLFNQLIMILLLFVLTGYVGVVAVPVSYLLSSLFSLLFLFVSFLIFLKRQKDIRIV